MPGSRCKQVVCLNKLQAAIESFFETGEDMSDKVRDHLSDCADQLADTINKTIIEDTSDTT